MGHFFHYPYSDKLIQSTLDFWGPKYAERGEQLTRADAEEILRNLGGFYDTLLDMDQAQRKRIIESYYHERDIEVVGHLARDLTENDFYALRHVEYALEHLANTPGLDALLRDLARIAKQDSDGKRIYWNSLAQLHAAGFLHKTLGYQVLAIEAKGHPILAPRRKGDRSCDLKASSGDAQVLYFECKDSSAEVLSEHRLKGVTHFTPMDENEVRDWIVQESGAADQKGADYLICLVPVWTSPSGWEDQEQAFYESWVKSVFEIQARPSKHDITIAKPAKLSQAFKGIYIIKAFGYLKLTFPTN